MDELCYHFVLLVCNYTSMPEPRCWFGQSLLEKRAPMSLIDTLPIIWLIICWSPEAWYRIYKFDFNSSIGLNAELYYVYCLLRDNYYTMSTSHHKIFVNQKLIIMKLRNTQLFPRGMALFDFTNKYTETYQIQGDRYIEFPGSCETKLSTYCK